MGTSANFEEAVPKAVNLGDDADTVGAVAGQIAGAVWRCNAIPEKWRERVAWCDKLSSLVLTLIAKAGPA